MDEGDELILVHLLFVSELFLKELLIVGRVCHSKSTLVAFLDLNLDERHKRRINHHINVL